MTYLIKPKVLREILLIGIFLFSIPKVVFTQNTRSQPNIVFILVDDLGWGELGYYGNTFNDTPNIDKLAKEGIKFMNAYAAAPVCSPTRASILTGQYPARIGITDFLPENSHHLLDPEKHVTINRPLQLEGYHTGFIGKWHLDTDFSNNSGGPTMHKFNDVIGTETKYIAGGDYFYPYSKINTIKSGRCGEFLTDRLFKEGIEFIKKWNKDPFFLYLSLYSVHARLNAPKYLVKKYKKKFDERYGAGQAERIFGNANRSRKADHKDNPYLAAMIEKIDDGVGRIMAELEKRNIDENTLIVFFSDNGGDIRIGNNGILRGEKTWLYEGGIKVNLIMRWPGKIEKGTETDVPVSSIDFYSTFLEISGAEKPIGQNIDGESLLPLLLNGVVPNREVLFWHYPSETNHWKDRMAGAVRKGEFKLLHFYDSNKIELYDLVNDPSEKKNLAQEMPIKKRELLRLLNNWKEQLGVED